MFKPLPRRLASLSFFSGILGFSKQMLLLAATVEKLELFPSPPR